MKVHAKKTTKKGTFRIVQLRDSMILHVEEKMDPNPDYNRWICRSEHTVLDWAIAEMNRIS